jgi:hypothetical protein
MSFSEFATAAQRTGTTGAAACTHTGGALGWAVGTATFGVVAFLGGMWWCERGHR